MADVDVPLGSGTLNLVDYAASAEYTGPYCEDADSDSGESEFGDCYPDELTGVDDLEESHLFAENDRSAEGEEVMTSGAGTREDRDNNIKKHLLHI